MKIKIGCSPNTITTLIELGQTEVLGPAFIGLNTEEAVKMAEKIELETDAQTEKACWLSRMLEMRSKETQVAPARPRNNRERR
ncbi:MAG: hypothetical protein AAB550_01295 [Patescibacteria group bacterium]